MNKDAITKLQFDKFVKLRNKGTINMNNIRRGAILIHEPEEVYETIMWNFSYLKQKFSK
jgi:hypothetical protein